MRLSPQAAPVGTIERVLVILTLVSLATLSPHRVHAAVESPSTTPAPGAPSGAIPMAEIASRAAEVSSLVRSVAPPSSQEVDAIDKQLPEMRSRIDGELASASNILRGQPTMDMLQAQQELWQQRLLETSRGLFLLTQRAVVLQDGLNRLTDLRKTWQETHDAAQASRAPDLLLERINGSLAALDRSREALETQRSEILALQSAVASEVDRADSMVARFTEAQESAVGRILARVNAPIWSAAAWSGGRGALAAHVRDFAVNRGTDVGSYLRDPSHGMRRHLGIVVLLAILMFAARRKVRPRGA